MAALQISATFCKSHKNNEAFFSSHQTLGGGQWRLAARVHICPPKAAGKKTNSICAESRPNSIDRRELLLKGTAAAAAAAAAGWGPVAAFAAPVQFPDLKRCTTPIDPGNGADLVDCCIPVSTEIKDFVLPASNAGLRLRPAAHLVTPEYVTKYNKAYDALRKLPPSDPRTWMQQANVHCAFCDAAYDADGTNIDYQVHSSWLFLPWHRWYLYFHERILASLIDDPSFALPFWSWDTPGGATVPVMYTDPSSALYDANRNASHLPPTVVDLNYGFRESGLSRDEQLAANDAVMYRQIVTSAKTPSLFFGKAYRQGMRSPGGGTLESVPHGTVHVWTGNPDNPNDEDMGTLYSAGRDPIFFAHHSNVDRLWQVWKSLGGRRTDLTDPDFLDATFLFYDETASLVRVRVGDALETTGLGYKYADLDMPWINGGRSSRSRIAMAAGPAGAPASAMATHGRIRRKLRAEVKELKAKLHEFKERASKKLEKVVSSLVHRPKKVKAEDYEEEILVLEGVEIPSDERVKFDVYINLTDDDAEEAGVLGFSEYAGSFVNVPHHGLNHHGDQKFRKSDFRLGIGNVLNELGIEDDDDFAITIVQRCETSVPISIDNIRIEYE